MSEYERWTSSGINCLELDADCSRCEIFKQYGRHKDYTGFAKCQQPKANAFLRAKGIKLPKADSLTRLLGKENP